MEFPAVRLHAVLRSATRTHTQTPGFLRQTALFVLLGLALYTGLYGIAERRLYAQAPRNRFFLVKTAPPAQYDHVILGASHAAVFDYQDMNARLEAMTGSKILNLSTVGGGIVVNRLLLDYFLVEHRTANVVYILDSFIFYSREWNEDRLRDARLVNQAPFDPALARLLLRSPAGRPVVLDYVSGFSKINNLDPFKPTPRDDEANRFTRTYRPVPQIDRQRIEYLYPKQIDDELYRRYLAEFEDLVSDVRSRGMQLIVVKPPIPERVSRMIPAERDFDAALQARLGRHGVTVVDFSDVNNDPQYFYDTDHLNRTGVLHFYEKYLAAALGRTSKTP